MTVSPDIPPVRPAACPVAVLLVLVTGRVMVRVLGAESAAGSGWPPVRWVDAVAGQSLVWCGQRRVRRLPVNEAAWALAARLGCPDLTERIGLNGDLVVAGLTADGRLGEVPELVVEAARRVGLLISPAPEPARGRPRSGAATRRAGLA